MNLFLSDLDNTLIYSYKRDIGDDKVLVETKEGKALSYMTGPSYRLLPEICRLFHLVPVTTRSLEQYQRISLFYGPEMRKTRGVSEADGGSSFVPVYALVSNGGILLRQGKFDPVWHAQSLALANAAESTLRQAEKLLSRDSAVSSEIRMVDGLFLFTKSSDPNATSARLRAALHGREKDERPAEVFENGEKIYVIPRGLDKGTGVRRLLALVSTESAVAAGDSSFDLPMLEEAATAYLPHALSNGLSRNFQGKQFSFQGEGCFSDWMLRHVLDTFKES